ncbi:MAG: N-6 DNA methylase, partial [Thermoplasmata archaeon]|nr:N-6 DNA methylase [Thermoplasmata archaeon]
MPNPPYNNRNLFSNHYLEHLISKTPEWGLDDHEKAFDEIKKIYEINKTKVKDAQESQLEEFFLRKIFDIINPHYIVQAKTETQEFPDYAFYCDDANRDKAYEKDAPKYTDCIVVGEAKKWIVDLGTREIGKKEKYNDPSFQLWMYLHKTGKTWGFLTNGKVWRIFHKDKLVDTFYEINLEELLINNDKEAFRYFYYFFRREAFIQIENNEMFIERIFKGSVDYAKVLGDDLKDKVYQAMKILSDGFIENPANKLDKNKPEDLVKVQHSTMRLLYRMLFLLYAEGKGLLDLSNPAYRNEYSFWKLKNGVKENSKSIKSYWADLDYLFNLINHGSEGCHIPKSKVFIPPYNGGLFSPEKNVNLTKWQLTDDKLIEAIKLLAIDQSNGSSGFIDYSTLDIRHLGSIYEGLLEFKLKVADKEMVASGGKSKTWMPLEEHNKDKKKKVLFTDFSPFDHVRAGDVYLATDKGERKATGSYYTPDYIIEYIVKNTIGPVVEEKWKEAEKKHYSLVEATLSINVLDPAMGSGHFLVGATDFLAAKLIIAMEKDVQSELMPDDKSYDIHWAKREVVSHCIYGVDLNEMAVELAKLSLWLTTISKDKPLSFLDHRLKHGNSLIGASMEDLPNYPRDKQGKEQRRIDIPEGFIKKFVETIEKLDSIDDDSLNNIKQKEKIFQELKETLEYDKIRTMADIRTSL